MRQLKQKETKKNLMFQVICSEPLTIYGRVWNLHNMRVSRKFDVYIPHIVRGLLHMVDKQECGSKVLWHIEIRNIDHDGA